MSVSAACAQIGVAVDSGGARETLCKGSFVLRPQDAVVLLACMPPSAEYWGWQTNVLARWGESADEGGEGVYFPQVSMIDTLNNLAVNTTGGAAGPWERVVAVIVTADARAAREARAALVDAGVPDAAVNVDFLDEERMTLWRCLLYTSPSPRD